MSESSYILIVILVHTSTNIRHGQQKRHLLVLKAADVLGKAHSSVKRNRIFPADHSKDAQHYL